MKKLTKLMALLLVVVSLIGITACSSSYGKIKKAFENEGYTVVEEMESLTDAMKENLEKEASDDMAIEVHIMTKALSSAVFIIEFKATDELVEYVQGSETIQGIIKDIASNEDVQAFYDALVDAGYANGNCLVFALLGDVTDIVKNA